MRTLNYFSTDTYNKQLQFSSQSALIANKRNAVYNRVMDNFEQAKANLKSLGLFSSASLDMQASTLGVTLKEASMQAYLDSFAGYLAVERSLSQMTELVVYKDKVTKSGVDIMPMIGKQSPREITSLGKVYTFSLDANSSGSNVTNNLSLPSGAINGTVKATYNYNDGNDDLSVVINVDKSGELYIAGLGSLDQITADSKYYPSTSTLTLVRPNGAKAATVDVEYIADGTSSQYDVPSGNYDELFRGNGTRIKPVQKYFTIKASVNKFEYEMDVIMAAINTKTIGSDLAAEMLQAVREEQRMAINNAISKTIARKYTGNEVSIDLSEFSLTAGRFESMLRVFAQGLVRTDSNLGMNTYKAVAATSYLVGAGIADLFSCMDASMDWVPNNTGFINGLVGFYKGRAVLRFVDDTIDHALYGTDLDANQDGTISKDEIRAAIQKLGYIGPWDGFACHKTMDGELAPVSYGILLPATDLPLVGNFTNTNEVAGGIYSVDGVESMADKLVQKFSVIPPVDWMPYNGVAQI